MTSRPPGTRSGAALAPARVVMCVGNDVSADNRVRRSARALAEAGHHVTVVGYSPTGEHQQLRLDDVDVVLVPVAWTLRDARRDKRRRHRTNGLPIVGYRTRDAEALAVARLEARQRELAADPQSATGPRRALVEGRRLVVTGRRAVTWRYRNKQREVWQRIDDRVGRSTAGVRWQSVVPEAADYDLAFSPVIDALRPDVVHAHDVHMVGVADGVARRAAAEGRAVRWVYDAHEWVPGLSRYDQRTDRVVAAWAQLEGRYVQRADAVVTVSPQLAEALQERYALPSRPAVVLNVPEQHEEPGLVGVREVVGLSAEPPLLVYSGGVQAARGVQTAVAALPELPGVHLAVVAVPGRGIGAVRDLLGQAADLGVEDRVHALDPVAPDRISQFLRSATLGLIPLRHFESHEMALANKLFEYLHAGLPVVVSDCRAQAAFAREHGVGVVHRADDPADLARAVRAALDDRSALVAAITPELLAEFSWPTQARHLVEAYDALLEPNRTTGGAR